MSNPVPDYRNTVFLPQTGFPLHANLPAREPVLLARWETMGLWRRLREQSRSRPPFILHDGPPYANGHLHIGHALNKIHKDVINRARQMAGWDANYIPGWDCHGLPIEWKVEEEYRASGRDKDEVPILAFRAECRAYAAKWMAIQEAEFRRLGVAGDWENRYATMDFPAEAAIAAEIGKFLLAGELYRGLRPVLWSPVEKTALAEAEVEYYDRESTTVWVRFPLIRVPDKRLEGARVVIWTTTPWTLPGNRAIAYGAGIEYALIEVKAVARGTLAKPVERLLVAQALIEPFCAAAGIVEHAVIAAFPGTAFAGAAAAHPLRGRGYEHDAPLLASDHVTTDQGSGFVHIAPGHGEEDFALSQVHGLEVPDTVGDDGRFRSSVPLFAGEHVYTAAETVCAALKEAGGLVARGKLLHSYPHSWRSKAPLIFRATPQWFIRVDGPARLRKRALEAIAATDFVPVRGRNRLSAMVAVRPDWCISRQRAWGVPIPVFVHRESGEPLRDPAVMAQIVEVFAIEGADAWFALPAQVFLGPHYRAEEFEQVRDIVDVWFESGSTHAFVLEQRGLPWPADLYLEGSDQHRGWFQSSLLEAVGTRGRAPFKAVVTDGFVLDEEGRKMSKSLGNVTAPQEVMKRFGADILRLWVMTSNTAEDLRIGPEILRQQAEVYRRLRNTLRWILGGLSGFQPGERLDHAELPELERWVRYRLAELDTLLRRAVESHDWSGVYPALHAFCATDLSAFYVDVRKDSLYCDRPDSPRRRAVRTLLDDLHRCLTTWLAPVLVFTAEDAWCARFGESTSVHLENFPAIPREWRDEALAASWERIRVIRRVLTGALERARAEEAIGAALQAAPILYLAPAESGLLAPDAWAELAIVSGVEIVAGEGPEQAFRLADVAGAAVTFRLAPGAKCARCWRVLPEVGEDPHYPALCRRCADAVASGLVCRAVA